MSSTYAEDQNIFAMNSSVHEHMNMINNRPDVRCTTEEMILYLHLYIQWHSGTWVILHVAADNSSSWLQNTVIPGSSEMPLQMLLKIQVHVIFSHNGIDKRKIVSNFLRTQTS